MTKVTLSLSRHLVASGAVKATDGEATSGLRLSRLSNLVSLVDPLVRRGVAPRGAILEGEVLRPVIPRCRPRYSPFVDLESELIPVRDALSDLVEVVRARFPDREAYLMSGTTAGLEEYPQTWAGFAGPLSPGTTGTLSSPSRSASGVGRTPSTSRTGPGRSHTSPKVTRCGSTLAAPPRQTLMVPSRSSP
jgi:hypothetical protein